MPSGPRLSIRIQVGPNTWAMTGLWWIIGRRMKLAEGAKNGASQPEKQDDETPDSSEQDKEKKA